MDRIINSNVILETDVCLDKTFEDLQKLKMMGIANYTSRILHTDGELLPAGAYSDYDTFVKCYFAMSDVKYGDIESLNNAKRILIEAMVNMSEKLTMPAVLKAGCLMARILLYQLL